MMLKVWRWWRGSFPDIETLYARGSSVPISHIFESLAVVLIEWWRMGGLCLNGYGCDGTDVGALLGGMG